VVNALGCAFKLCHSDADFATTYEIAIKGNVVVPPHFHSELFYCYLRMHDMKKMQQVAQRAYKQTDNSKFIFWTASCIVLQKDLPKQMLAVAEKLLLKVFNDIRPENPPGSEELLLLITILMKEDKLEDSVPFIQQLLARKMTSSLQDEDHFKENVNLVVMQKQQELFLLLDLNRLIGKLDNAINFAYAILDVLPDQWNAFEFLHSMAFSKSGSVLLPESSICKSFSGVSCFEESRYASSSSSSSTAVAPVVNYDPEQYQKFLEELLRKHPRLRGPLLAKLYFGLESVLQSKELSSPSSSTAELTGGGKEISDWIEKKKQQNDFPLSSGVKSFLFHLLLYVSQFKAKFCCFQDLKYVLFLSANKLPLPEERTALFKLLVEWLEEYRSKQLKELQEFLEAKNSEGISVNEISLNEKNNNNSNTASLQEQKDEEEDDDEEDNQDDPKVSTNVEKDKEVKEKKNKKKQKKKKNSKKSSKSQPSGSEEKKVEEEIDKEKKLGIDFDHVNTVGTKDNKGIEVVLLVLWLLLGLTLRV
jgi:hypothetical protein